MDTKYSILAEYACPPSRSRRCLALEHHSFRQVLDEEFALLAKLAGDAI